MPEESPKILSLPKREKKQDNVNVHEGDCGLLTENSIKQLLVFVVRKNILIQNAP